MRIIAYDKMTSAYIVESEGVLGRITAYALAQWRPELLEQTDELDGPNDFKEAMEDAINDAYTGGGDMNEAKYYSKIILELSARFGGQFYRWESQAWGCPDLFGFDSNGTLQFVEVKMNNKPLRPMQAQFFAEVEEVQERETTRRPGLIMQPGLWVARIDEEMNAVDLYGWKDGKETRGWLYTWNLKEAK